MTLRIIDSQLASGVRVRDYLPSEAAREPFVWLHGGAFMWGGLDQHESDAVARAIATAGRHVRTVDYRLVTPLDAAGSPVAEDPHRYPAATDDATEAVLDLSNAVGHVMLGGASAGACVAASIVDRVADRLDAVVFAYGLFHEELPQPHPHGLGFLTARQIRAITRNYAGAAGRAAFPAGRDLSSFPRTLLVDADRDSLRASSDAFAAELTGAAVPVTHEVVAGTTHGFLDQPEQEAFSSAIDLICRWLSQRERRL